MPRPARMLIIFFALSIGGCASTANRDFRRPDQAGLILGQSTEQDTIAAEETPQSQTVTTLRNHYPEHPALDWARDGAKYYDILRYAFGQANGSNGSFQKRANFVFANGRLAKMLTPGMKFCTPL